MKIYEYSNEDDEDSVLLPELEEDEKLKTDSLKGTQHFTQPPARYTEASFVKTIRRKRNR